MIRTSLICLLMVLTGTSFATEQFSIKLTGLNQQLTKAVKSNLDLSNYPTFAAKSPSNLTALYGKGFKQIKQALQPYGYYKAKVSGNLQKTKQNGHNWQINYKVTIGNPIRIKKLDLEIKGPGGNATEFKKIINNNRLKANKILVIKNYQSLINRLQNTAISQGYFDAKFSKHQIQINLQQNIAKVIVIFNTGKRYRFAKTSFKNTFFNKTFLQRFVPYKAGEYFSNKKVIELQNNLYGSDFFNQVDITPKPNRNSHEVPIKINLINKKSQQYTIGAGFGTETGPRGLLGWKLRHITKTGQHFNTALQISKIYTQVTASYIIPGANPVTDYMSINLGQTYTNITPYKAHETIFGISKVKQLGNWQRSLELNQYVISFSTPTSPERRQKYLVPSIQYNLLLQKPAGYWQQGLFASFQLQGAANGYLSDTSFIQINNDLRYSYSINQDNRIFTQLIAGATRINNLNNLAPSFRYYAGGLNSIRGYSYKTLSPLGNGGKYLLTGSINLEHHWFGKWSSTIFYDAGNAFNSFNKFNIKSGAGFGVSWQSPIGQVSAYLARSFGTPSHRWFTYMSIGNFL